MRALACIAALVLAVPAAAAGPVRATLTVSSRTPVADTPWRYAIIVRDRSGKALEARARLQILLGDLVVGCWRGAAMAPCQGASSGTWISFKGKRAGTLTWPAQSVGVTLTFQAIVLAKGRTSRLRVSVRVQSP